MKLPALRILSPSYELYEYEDWSWAQGVDAHPLLCDRGWPPNVLGYHCGFERRRPLRARVRACVHICRVRDKGPAAAQTPDLSKRLNLPRTTNTRREAMKMMMW